MGRRDSLCSRATAYDGHVRIKALGRPPEPEEDAPDQLLKSSWCELHAIHRAAETTAVFLQPLMS